MANYVNSTTLNEDYFAVLFNENHASRYFFLTFAIITTLLGPLTLYCVIWFERFGSDQKRTLINMLPAVGCWSAVEFLILVQIPEIFRYIYGPLNPTVCLVHLFFRSRIYCDLLLQLDAAAIVRYVSIFWLKNPAGLRDEFWIVFSVSFIRILNIITNFVWHFLTPRQTVIYYICTGQDPIEEYKKSLKVYSITEILSILLHLGVNLKVYIYKKKDLTHGKSRYYDKSKSLASSTTNLIAYSYLISTALIMTKLNGIKPEDLQKFPNYIYVYFRFLAIPGIGSLITFFMYFFRHSGLRRLMIGELKEFYICYISKWFDSGLSK